MDVRQARTGDAAAIAEVHTRVWQHAYEDIFGAERLAAIDVSARAEGWRRSLERDEPAFVAEEDRRVIGFASVGASRDPDADAELYAIYVLPEAWGGGTGAALLRAGAEALRDAGYREAILWVLEDNPRARRFYEREGWTLDGARRDDDVVGVRVAEVRYRRTL